MKFWQILALLSGAIIAAVLALASISYNTTLGTGEPAFRYLPVTNTTVFSSLALAFDLGMIASIFGFWHWVAGPPGGGRFLRHSVHYSQCVFSAFGARLYCPQCDQVLGRATASPGSLRLARPTAHTSARARGRASFRQASRRGGARVYDCKRRSCTMNAWCTRPVIVWPKPKSRPTSHRSPDWNGSSPSPCGFSTPPAGPPGSAPEPEWQSRTPDWLSPKPYGRYLAVHSVERAPSTCSELNVEHHMIIATVVSAWLGSYEQKQPQHCAQLYARYAGWCTDNDHTPLTDRQFYTPADRARCTQIPRRARRSDALCAPTIPPRKRLTGIVVMQKAKHHAYRPRRVRSNNPPPFQLTERDIEIVGTCRRPPFSEFGANSLPGARIGQEHFQPLEGTVRASLP